MTEGNEPRTGPGKGGRASLPSLVHLPDLRIAVVILIICGVLFYATTTWDEVSEMLAQGIQPHWFPRLLLGTIVLMACMLPFEHLFLKIGKEQLDEDRKARVEPISMLTGLLLIGIVFSIQIVGTFGAMILVSLGLPMLWGRRPSATLLVYVVVFPSVVTFVFTKILLVYFHSGWLGKLFQ